MIFKTVAEFLKWSQSQLFKNTYLGAPYTHNDLEVMRHRRRSVTNVAAHLLRRGIVVYSPITHYYPMTLFTDLPRGDDNVFWNRLNESFIKHWAEILVVYRLPAWSVSRGLENEIETMKRRRLPIVYLDEVHTDMNRKIETQF